MIEKTVNKPQTRSAYPYELFFEISPDLLCIAGFDGFFKKVNPAVIQLLGYTAEELYGRPIDDFVFEEDKKITSKARNAIRHNNPLLHFDNRYVTKGGKIIWLSWTSMPIEDNQIIFAIAKNITHQRHLEEERNKIFTQLKAKNNHLKKLTYTTSHDLRAPVNNMLMIFELLDLSCIQDAGALHLLSILKSSSEGLKHVLNNYVDRLGEEERSWHPEEQISFHECFNDVLNSIQTLVESSGAIIHIDFAKAEEVYFNRSYLVSIFLNLLTNSIKYARPGIAPVVTITTQVIDGTKTLVVSDNGRGFNEQLVKDRMFRAYQQFHQHKDSKGIGLYLVHQHIISLGGSIKATSQEDNGATFTIQFRQGS